jgi:hypothetical protein
LLINEQQRLLELPNQIVRATKQLRTAEANAHLITIPTGDGMALVSAGIDGPLPKLRLDN